MTETSGESGPTRVYKAVELPGGHISIGRQVFPDPVSPEVWEAQGSQLSGESFDAMAVSVNRNVKRRTLSDRPHSVVSIDTWDIYLSDSGQFNDPIARPDFTLVMPELRKLGEGSWFGYQRLTYEIEQALGSASLKIVVY